MWICAAGDNGGVIRLSSVVNCLSGSLWHCGNGQLSTAGARWQPNTVGHIVYQYCTVPVLSQYQNFGLNTIYCKCNMYEI